MMGPFRSPTAIQADLATVRQGPYQNHETRRRYAELAAELSAESMHMWAFRREVVGRAQRVAEGLAIAGALVDGWETARVTR